MVAVGSVIEREHPLLTSDEIYQLISQIHEGNPSETRIEAIERLAASRDPRGVRPVMACCNDNNALLRTSAIKALCFLQSPRSVGTLVERMCDRQEHKEIREYAAVGLGLIQSYAATESLKQVVLDDDEDQQFRIFVRHILDASGQ